MSTAEDKKAEKARLAQEKADKAAAAKAEKEAAKVAKEAAAKAAKEAKAAAAQAAKDAKEAAKAAKDDAAKAAKQATLNKKKDAEAAKATAAALEKKAATLSPKKPAGKDGGLRRAGAAKRNRGRINIDLCIQRGPTTSIIVLSIKDAQDLMEMNKQGTADAYVKLYLIPDPEKASKRKTNVVKGTRNPVFNEQFVWAFQNGTDLTHMRLSISVWNDSALKRNQFMGSMSFSLQDLANDADTVTRGWFKLLDEKKGDIQAVPYRPKKELDAKTAEVQARRLEMQKRMSGEFSTLLRQQSAGSLGPRSADEPQAGALSPAGKTATASAAAAATAMRAMVVAKVKADDFNYTKVLGQGSFGKVFLADHKKTGDIFAIKSLRKETVIQDDDVDATMAERRVLALSHGNPFLTRMHATFQTADHLFFVMEFVSGGDLMFHIQAKDAFSLELSVFYTAEICSGLWYLHDQGVFYRDLKLDNVMLDADGHVKIADFGLAKENMFGLARTTTFCGTPGYMAPEIIQEKPYGASVDFWALGIIVYEFLTGDAPFEAEEDDELFEQITNKKLSLPGSWAPATKAFVDGLLTKDPDARLGNGAGGKAAIQAHPFFAGLDWAKLEAREIPPPWAPPKKADSKDLSNFDAAFTNADPTLTPEDPAVVRKIGAMNHLFVGFSYVNQAYGAFKVDGAVAEDAPTPNAADLRRYKWYRPDIAREEMGKALRDKPTGTFYVRESSSQPGCYALSVATGGGKRWNGLITPMPDGSGGIRYRLYVTHKFGSFAELFQHYTTHAVTQAEDGREVFLVLPE